MVKIPLNIFRKPEC
jgi:hypothetical protein